MKATTVLRWAIALLVLGLITTNLLAQPTPPRPEGWSYPASPGEPYPAPPPPVRPQYDPYPAPPEAPYPLPTVPLDPHPLVVEPVILTRTNVEPAISEAEIRRIFSKPREQQTTVTDPEWEAEFRTVHNREPSGQDLADRQWSLEFLGRTGRPPTDGEWIAHYYDRH